MRIVLLVIIYVFLLAGQELKGQVLKPANYRSFIPEGFTVLDSAYGDLNRDAYKDLILILKNNNEKLDPDASRPLLLFAGTPIKLFKLIARNDSVVLCAGCGGVFGDPYQGISIKNGFFSIEHYGGSNWRWTRIITFKYDSKTSLFKLHRDGGVSFHSSDPNNQERIITNKGDFGRLPFLQYSHTKGM